mmetsp:Transcript_39039/g.125488  ORF Transcript_39039/g.125488 Transcript_39039/m.125488 type:complete len:310 (+) Transcript_39039:3092-4021(+)
MGPTMGKAPGGTEVARLRFRPSPASFINDGVNAMSLTTEAKEDRNPPSPCSASRAAPSRAPGALRPLPMPPSSPLASGLSTCSFCGLALCEVGCVAARAFGSLSSGECRKSCFASALSELLARTPISACKTCWRLRSSILLALCAKRSLALATGRGLPANDCSARGDEPLIASEEPFTDASADGVVPVLGCGRGPPPGREGGEPVGRCGEADPSAAVETFREKSSPNLSALPESLMGVLGDGLDQSTLPESLAVGVALGDAPVQSVLSPAANLTDLSSGVSVPSLTDGPPSEKNMDTAGGCPSTAAQGA